MEKKRKEAKAVAQVTRLAAVLAGDAKAQTEEEMVRVRDALGSADEARHKAEAEDARIEVERTSLMLDIEVTKD